MNPVKNIKLIIPPRKFLTQTSWGDPVFWHFYPGASIVYRKRLRNAVKLLQGKRFENLLEIGYGSGILLPTLSKFAKKVTAMDIHKKTKEVEKLLDWYQVSNVKLDVGNIMEMRYTDNQFDGCVIVSTLEDIPESARAAKEIKRVVAPGGTIIVSFPVKSFITDSFFRLLGEDPDEIQPTSHRYIYKFLSEYFTIKRMLKFPFFLPFDLTLYISLECVNDKK